MEREWQRGSGREGVAEREWQRGSGREGVMEREEGWGGGLGRPMQSSTLVVTD